MCLCASQCCVVLCVCVCFFFLSCVVARAYDRLKQKMPVVSQTFCDSYKKRGRKSLFLFSRFDRVSVADQFLKIFYGIKTVNFVVAKNSSISFFVRTNVSLLSSILCFRRRSYVNVGQNCRDNFFNLKNIIFIVFHLKKKLLNKKKKSIVKSQVNHRKWIICVHECRARAPSKELRIFIIFLFVCLFLFASRVSHNLFCFDESTT